MKAELKELYGKYYGTEIVVTFDDEWEEIINIWDSSDRTPSIRQIQRRDKNLTQQDYDSNIEIESYIYHGEFGKIQDELVPTDSHYESKTSLDRALQIINKIND